MKPVKVSLGARSYSIEVEPGLLAHAAERIARIAAPSRVAVLTHPRLASLYAPDLLEGFAARGVTVTLLTVVPGERSKSLAGTARLYRGLLEAGLDRKGLVVTLGGGVVGDLGGFVAATYLRGVPWVTIPTTLLAQVDASVGGKTGVNMPGGKNLVGAFHQPRAVLIDPLTLDTLPAREMRSGLAEILKYGIISDEVFLSQLVSDMPRLLRRDPRTLTATIRRSCEIKASIVEEDETEQGRRAILNFGHTVGHALESVTCYRRYKHGEAIAIGMVSAALIGEEIGVTPREVTKTLLEALREAKLPVAFPDDVPVEAILEAMNRDKKRVAGMHRFVLVPRIGRALPAEKVSPAVVFAALERQKRQNLSQTRIGEDARALP